MRAMVACEGSFQLVGHLEAGHQTINIWVFPGFNRPKREPTPAAVRASIP